MVSLRLHSKHWLVDEEGNMIMGEGRREIFENIAKTGSLNQTAKIMKMSYKGVWGKVKATERSMNMKIVHSDRRLGSRLTEDGEKLLERYKRLKKECMKADDEIFSAVFK